MSRAVAAASMLLVALGATTVPSIAFTPLAFLQEGQGSEQVAWTYWQQIRDGQPVSFSINSAGTPDIDLDPNDPEIDEFEAIELGFAVWEAVDGVDVSFDLSTTTKKGFSADGENTIFFADYGDLGYGAVTILTFDNQTGRILDVDIHMNDHTTNWRTSKNDADGEPLPCPCPGSDPSAAFSNDVQGLAAHEIGHALGLDHSAIGTQASASTPTMYPRGIFYVPGDENTPPNSRYRTLEPDDVAGLRTLYGDATPATATLRGTVHDRWDRPLLGAHVVARETTTGVEIGAVSGVLEGPLDPAGWAVSGLPPGSWELRAEPIDGSGPGFVGPWHMGGIPQGLLQLRFPAEQDLPTMFHKLVHSRHDATPVQLGAGDDMTIDFRPVAKLPRLPAFFRRAISLPIAGHANTEVTGPLASATMTVAVEGATSEYDIPLDGSDFSVSLPPGAAGSMFEISVDVETTAGDSYSTVPVRTQVGLSASPLVLISKTGSGQLSVVDSNNLHELAVTSPQLSFPLGHAFHREKFGVYVTNFGTDRISFVPFTNGLLPPTRPDEYDTDGDGLIDALEASFGTDVADPDTDGDLTLDGDEISETYWIDPASGASGTFHIRGGIVTDATSTPIGAPRVRMAVWNVTKDAWASSMLTLTPSGRIRLKLDAASNYQIRFFDVFTSTWVQQTVQFGGDPGDELTLGAYALPVDPADPPLADSGSDPLDPLDGPQGLLRPVSVEIALPTGTDPYGVALDPRNPRFLYVTGYGTDRLWRVDTKNNVLFGSNVIGDGPKGMALTRDGSRLYVAIERGHQVAVVDAETLDVIETIAVDGKPHYVSLSSDGSTAVVTATEGSDIIFIDTDTNAVIEELSTGVAAGMVFLSGQARHDLALAGTFVAGANEVALIDAVLQEARVIDLGATVSTTSGMAIDPTGTVAWVVNYSAPALVELDLASGTILRTLPFDAVDVRDVSVQSVFRRPSVKGLRYPSNRPRPR